MRPERIEPAPQPAGGRVDVSYADGTVTLALVGDFDAEFAGTVREALLAAEPGARSVALDLSGVAFVDSSGLGVIAAASTRAEREGRTFALLRPSPSVARTLRMFGLTSLVVDEGGQPDSIVP